MKRRPVPTKKQRQQHTIAAEIEDRIAGIEPHRYNKDYLIHEYPLLAGTFTSRHSAKVANFANLYGGQMNTMRAPSVPVRFAKDDAKLTKDLFGSYTLEVQPKLAEVDFAALEARVMSQTLDTQARHLRRAKNRKKQERRAGIRP